MNVSFFSDNDDLKSQLYGGKSNVLWFVLLLTTVNNLGIIYRLLEEIYVISINIRNIQIHNIYLMVKHYCRKQFFLTYVMFIVK